MADQRSSSLNDGKMQIRPYYGPDFGNSSSTRPDYFRSYSTSYASSSSSHTDLPGAVPGKLRKFNSTRDSGSYSWGFNDSEFQRKKRVAGYKVYTVEGKVKGSFRKSFKWLKDRYTHVVYGWL